MARKDFLFSLKEEMNVIKSGKKLVGLILIQINEAHSTRWPIGRDHTPEVQKNFEERVERANEFSKDCPFPVYIDSWSNEFDLRFRAWPDKFYLIDSDKIVLDKSKYGKEGDQDGMIQNDYSVLIYNMIHEC